MKRSASWIALLFMACGAKDENAHSSGAAVSTSQPTVTSGKVPTDANVAELPVDASVAEISEKQLGPKQTAQSAKVTEALRTILKSTTVNAQLTVSNNAIEIDAPNGECNGRMLIQLRDRLRRIKIDPGAEFDKMDCGAMGDEIDLHSKDGCPANQSDLLILTDAGVRRDRYTEGMSNLANMIKNDGPALMLVATGCDATVLSIVSVGGDIDCNESTLKILLGRVHDQLAKLGFKRVACGLDGPAISVR